jgi:ATP-dependent Lhr-like helicase
VLAGGQPVLYLERGGKSLQTLPAAADPALVQAALVGLRELIADGRFRSLQLERVDGEPIGQSALRDLFAEAGFRPAYRGWALRAPVTTITG